MTDSATQDKTAALMVIICRIRVPKPGHRVLPFNLLQNAHPPQVGFWFGVEPRKASSGTPSSART